MAAGFVGQVEASGTTWALPSVAAGIAIEGEAQWFALGRLGHTSGGQLQARRRASIGSLVGPLDGGFEGLARVWPLPGPPCWRLRWSARCALHGPRQRQ